MALKTFEKLLLKSCFSWLKAGLKSNPSRLAFPDLPFSAQPEGRHKKTGCFLPKHPVFISRLYGFGLQRFFSTLLLKNNPLPIIYQAVAASGAAARRCSQW
jgi:hypothetical protein